MDSMTAKGIAQLLDAPVVDRRPTVRELSASAPTAELIAALIEAQTPLTKQILCDILGERSDGVAVPALVGALEDESSGVRGSAADALAKIGDISAGGALNSHFASEKDSGVRQMLALALGSVGYKPATPLLLQVLDDSNGTLRGCAAWSLGALKAADAKDPLQAALARETDPYATRRMREALASIANLS